MLLPIIGLVRVTIDINAARTFANVSLAATVIYEHGPPQRRVVLRNSVAAWQSYHLDLGQDVLVQPPAPRIRGTGRRGPDPAVRVIGVRELVG
jgi:hypothetical protein